MKNRKAGIDRTESDRYHGMIASTQSPIKEKSNDAYAVP